MKLFALAVAFVGLAAVAPVNAQILSRSRLPGGGTVNDGSWSVVGRDNSGNTIYERRTSDANGNVVIQRARRDANGNMVILSTRTVANRSRNDCTYNRTTNSVGDIIFGRSTANTNCTDRTRVDGGWYQVGRGPNNNSTYERRTYDANGNVVIQHARRNSDGTFTILNTRTVRNKGSVHNGHGRKGDKEFRKEQKREEKRAEKAERKANERDDDEDDRGIRSDRDDDRDDDRGIRSDREDDRDDKRGVRSGRGDDRDDRRSNAVRRGNGRGRDNKKEH